MLLHPIALALDLVPNSQDTGKGTPLTRDEGADGTDKTFQVCLAISPWEKLTEKLAEKPIKS